MGTKIGWRAGLAFVSTVAIICGFLQGPAQSRAAEDAPAGPHFDGLYQSEKIEGKKGIVFYHYLRFYADGTVIEIGMTNPPDEVWRTFDRKNDSVSRGTYTVTGTKIVFTTESKYGKIDYDGTLKGDQIEFHVTSQINKNQSDEKYTFVKLAEKEQS